MKTWKIYIVTHGPVWDDFYSNDPDFAYKNFALFNVSNTILTHKHFEVINACELEGYRFLGKWYAEAEVIYNIYKLRINEGVDYIGFIHWDYELKSFDPTIGYHVTRAIEESLAQNEHFISFSGFDFEYAYNLNVMMDLQYPNQCYGTEGKNCLDAIMEQYNQYHGTALEKEKVMAKRINLCSAFLCSREVFNQMLPFYTEIIDSGFLDQFDTNHEYRFQGGMMERYIGICSLHYQMKEIPLYHHYNHSKEASSQRLLFEKMKKRIFSYIKKILRLNLHLS